MALQRWLERTIDGECAKLISRHELYAKRLAEELVRRQRRTTTAVAPLRVHRPTYWSDSPGFNPYAVRRRQSATAHSMRAKLLDGVYRPRNPSLYSIPKPDGGTRPISVFQVADNAVSRFVYKSIWRKNRALFSSHSYAYRDDVGISDALHYMRSEFGQTERLFVAEYDFQKYFDSIRHDALWETIESRRIALTDLEHHVLDSFLTVPEPNAGPYTEVGGAPRHVGVPQGTSVSLLLANIAAMPLDRELERLGVGFVRYADDTIIWSHDYGRICDAANLLRATADLIGPEIHRVKSAGVSLFLPTGEASTAELTAKDRVAYVGHSISRDTVSLGDRPTDELRARVNALLRDNLLRALQAGDQDLTQISAATDRDYVTYVLQLRRYLYGDLSEAQLRRYERGGIPPRKFKGFMSFFPLVDDADQLRQLDEWIVHQTWLALRKRARLLTAAGVAAPPLPHGLAVGELARYHHISTAGAAVDLRLPSVRRMSAVVRKATARYGAGAVRKGVDPYDY